MKYDTPRLRAKAAGQTRYEGLPCKYGHGNTRFVSNQYCVECRRLAKELARAKARAARPPKQKKTLTLEELEAKAEAKKAWERDYWKRPENIGVRRAKKAKRRCSKLQRTPKWLTAEDKNNIKAIYELAAFKSNETGFLWHVDHVYPLRGKNVSGLHVPNNLQVIPAKENLKKGNRLDS